MNKTLLFAAASAALVACNNSGNLEISGNFPDADTVYVGKFGPDELIPLDTVVVSNGSFSWSTDVEEPQFMIVNVDNVTQISLLAAPGESIVIESKEDGLGYSVSGSAGSERILKVNELIQQGMDVMDSLTMVSQTYTDSANFVDVREELNAAFKQMFDNTKEQLIAMINEDPSSLSNLFIFPQYIGRIQIINPSENWNLYKLADSAMVAAYPENEHALFFRGQIVQYEQELERSKAMEAAATRTAVGSIAPDIALPSPNGDVMKLSDLRGQVVLIDFWASWCRPCRAENPNVVRVYNMYKDKGFTVFSVSLDGMPNQADPKKLWMEAIAQDGLAWKGHVSDLKGWDSEVVSLYGFNGIPHSVLIDKDGTVLAKDLRGVGLENKLKEIFQ